jgi:hypothetical protein
MHVTRSKGGSAVITKQIEIQLFSYEELSERAREHVREMMEPQHDWWEFVYEDWKEKLGALGFEDVEINFSGFWNQGDGASFTASVDLEKWIKAGKQGNQYRLTLNAIGRGDVDSTVGIKRTSSHYYHYSTVSCESIQSYADLSPILEGQLEAIAEGITEHVRDLSKEIYRDLEAEYEGLTSEDYIAEECKEMQWLFLASGRLHGSAFD